MNPEIKQRIEQINNGEVPEGYTHKYHIKPDLWMDEPLDAFFYKVKEKNSEKKYNTVFTNSATNGVIPQSQYFEKDIANEENIDGYYIVRAGDYIYNPRISEKAPYGPINQNLTGCTGIVSPLYTVFSKKENVCICDDYIRYYLDSAEWNKYIYSVANYGARFDRMNISDSDFMNMPIALPPFAEQQKIAEILMQCDKLIELYQNETDELQKMKKVYLSKMFPKKGENIPEWRFPQFNDSWERRKLGDVGQTYTGLSGKTKDDFGHGQARFVTYMNVFSNPVTNPEVTEPIEIDSKQNEVEVGDVFFTTSSETPEEVGMTSVLLEKQGKTYLNSFCFGFRPTEKFDSYFLAYMLRSQPIREKIILLAQGISRYNISKNKVMEISVSVPSMDEQKRVGQYFRNLDNLITLHQHKLEEMKKYKKSLMQLLLTGIVRV